MAGLQQRRKTRHDRHGRGHGADAHRALRHIGLAAQLLLQDGVLVQHALGRGQHPLALGRETGKGAVALDDHHPELSLERPQRVGECRLRDVTGLRGPTEVPVLMQRHQVAQGRQQVHARARGAWVQVSLEILIDGNLLEKSLFLAAIDSATLRATAL